MDKNKKQRASVQPEKKNQNIPLDQKSKSSPVLGTVSPFVTEIIENIGTEEAQLFRYNFKEFLRTKGIVGEKTRILLNNKKINPDCIESIGTFFLNASKEEDIKNIIKKFNTL